MSSENVARLFVGVGFLWVVIVLLIALFAGFDKPSTWLRFLTEASGSATWRYVYLALTLFVVPMGMLTYLLDLWGDPVALWVKWAAPGALASVYLLFLVATLPDAGQPFLLAFDSVTPFRGLADTPEATVSWLLRFVTAFAVLACIPGVVGAALGFGSGGTGARRR